MDLTGVRWNSLDLTTAHWNSQEKRENNRSQKGKESRGDAERQEYSQKADLTSTDSLVWSPLARMHAHWMVKTISQLGFAGPSPFPIYMYIHSSVRKPWVNKGTFEALRRHVCAGQLAAKDHGSFTEA